jgi:hypothetical protein
LVVIPAKAGIQGMQGFIRRPWTPASAGVTGIPSRLRLELRDERRFVFKTAQVQNHIAGFDVADNRDRQRPQIAGQRLDRAAGASRQRPQG